MRTRLVCLVALALAGCQDRQPAPGPSATSSAPAAPAAPSTPPAEPRGVARKVHIGNDLFAFDYAYPAEAAAIPALKAWLDADLIRQKTEIAGQAKDGKADAKANDFPFNPYGAGVDWQRVANLPGWLSLSATTYAFTGGAHPNHGYTALLWDKAANRQRAAVDLFQSKAALSAAIRAPFCDILDAQRAKRRGEPVNRNSGDEFDQCIDPVASTVILGSTNGQTFDRIGVLVGPYEAGPYAEGDYDVTLPVTQPILDAVKPEYKAAFSLKR